MLVMVGVDWSLVMVGVRRGGDLLFQRAAPVPRIAHARTASQQQLRKLLLKRDDERGPGRGRAGGHTHGAHTMWSDRGLKPSIPACPNAKSLTPNDVTDNILCTPLPSAIECE